VTAAAGRDRIQEIRDAIQQVQEDRQRTGGVRSPTGHEIPPGELGKKQRAGRIPLVGPLLRWLYGILKAPTRIRDLLTLIRLAEMEAGRDRAEMRALGLDLEGAMATLRAELTQMTRVADEQRSRADRLQFLTEEVAGNQAGLDTALAGVKDLVDGLQEDSAASAQVARTLESALARLTGQMEATETDVTTLTEGLARAREALGEVDRERAHAADRQAAVAGRQAQVTSLYERLEARFRGSRDLVQERQRIYLPTLEEVDPALAALPVVDLGCGRGEWLELLQTEGVPAQGVDSNPALVAACREQGLQVEHTSAATYLSGLPDESLRGVTCFHLLEHLDFTDWLHLVREVWRVLAPGGVAIFETPNPDNLLVAGKEFYLDPTHVRPIPSQLLLFVAEEAGFCNSKVLELHPRDPEAPRSGGPENDLLHHHLQGAQDYSVVTWKAQRPPS
jgi:2-polyprenyl-3-methyl-5-hydroxy-6-metoxy-1,4-benzoquinol methylase